MPHPQPAAELLDDVQSTTLVSPTDRVVGAFVTEHYDRLVRLAWLICRDGQDAADAVQRGLEHVWRQRATLRDEASLRPGIDRVVVRAAIRLGRRP